MPEDSRQDDAALLDALRPYLALLSGLIEVSAGKAAGLAQSVMTQGAATGAEAGQRVVAITSAGLDPEQFAATVREEVDRAVRRLGFVRADELTSLRRQIERLETEVEGLRARADALSAVVGSAGSRGAASKSDKKKKVKKKDEGRA
ncbi:MAG: hypothetical protein ACKOMX_10310 [Actinomycetota bacterium]